MGTRFIAYNRVYQNYHPATTSAALELSSVNKMMALNEIYSAEKEEIYLLSSS